MKARRLDVVIVGAGFAGMYLLHRLRSIGMQTLVVEAGSGVGGTWFWNCYPGARCDVESMQYSYQFDAALQAEWDWTERYAGQPEILDYANHVADRFDLRRDICFNTRVVSARFKEIGENQREKTARWEIHSEDGQQFTTQFLVLATGCLSVPNWPPIDGLDNFAGPVYHTAQWPHSPVDLTDQRVAVIGSGSSAIQSIPEIARQASSLTVFQRTANYSIPAHNRPSDPQEVADIKSNYPAMRARARSTFGGIDGVYNTQSALEASAEDRIHEYERRWNHGGLTFGGAYGDLLKSREANDTAAGFVRDKIRSIVKDPETANLLCPKNIIGGKRICVDSGYYATYNLEHVSLVDLQSNPIVSIEPDRVNLQNRSIAIDVLVMATGFDAMTGAITRIDIRGRNDLALRSLWADGPSSYLGLGMSGFPNLFTVTGPGSPSVFTNMLPTIEQHVEWISDCIGYTVRQGYSCIEVEAEAQQAWWAHCQEVAAVGLKATTDSWYTGANVAGKAKVFMPYFGGFPAYCQKCEEVVADDYAGFSFSC